ncbi:hypothetical protein B296_00042070 [Ensete ventricosum]|uniref:Uncharacterized protein n=1 Tax=Ensete ventricosum TaxID=4639 RepID=A0A426ZJK6_ENSVE|nr:hypothetical protein B296_00042070 [Ensete ventricosum]
MDNLRSCCPPLLCGKRDPCSTLWDDTMASNRSATTRVSMSATTRKLVTTGRFSTWVLDVESDRLGDDGCNLHRSSSSIVGEGRGAINGGEDVATTIGGEELPDSGVVEASPLSISLAGRRTRRSIQRRLEEDERYNSDWAREPGIAVNGYHQ